MKLYLRNIFTFICGALAIVAITPGVLAQNLIQNGSAELFDSTSHAPLYWTATNGQWFSQLHDPSFADSAKDGQYFFYPGGASPDTLYQDVDVSSYASAIDAGTRSFFFLGYVQCYPQGNGTSDQCRIMIVCFNAAKSTTLYTFDSDTISSQSKWSPVYNTFTAPPTTRYVRIMLIGTRRSGFADDAYFDALSLSTQPSGVTNVLPGNKASIYPNPASETMTISGAAGSQLDVYDLTGAEVVKQDIHKDNEVLDIRRLPPGSYLARITCTSTGLQRVIKLEKR